MKIVADSAIPFFRESLSRGPRYATCPAADRAEDVRDADALVIRTRTRCDERLLAGSRVRLIATATIGFDHIDTAWCAAHGIRVATAAGCNARGVLQWAGAVLAHLARTQGWKPAQRTLGIVGVGHVGSLIGNTPHCGASASSAATRRAKSASIAGSCRWKRSHAKPTYSPFTRRSTPRRGTWPARACSHA